MVPRTPTTTLVERELLSFTPFPSPTPCQPIIIPPGGVLILGPHHTINITSPITYDSNTTCPRPDPFFASTSVFIYVLAVCTAIAWILFILLLIAQRSFHSARSSASSKWINGRGLSTAIAGRTPIGGLGSRPWLQKAAVALVACGLVVASVDAFREAAVQHRDGVSNAVVMTNKVSGSEEVRIMRVISNVLTWLAQVQTLIRLFPRRKEKLIIKWLGFTLILCDLVFSCLNYFLDDSPGSRGSPKNYQDAIPALNYLFQLAISLLYLAWVFYYVITKRRYAFFRLDQLNMTIIALLAMTSIAIPVAFFVADISVPEVAGWGDLMRWVGAAAASIVVWEWVDRIESTERQERKDGILGREVFDEDEDPGFDTRSRADESSDTEIDESRAQKTLLSQKGRHSLLNRFANRKAATKVGSVLANGSEKRLNLFYWAKRDRQPEPQEEAPVSDRDVGQDRPLSPPSRTNTTSAGSTVYAVHYHPIVPTPPAPEVVGGDEQAEESRARSNGENNGTGQQIDPPKSSLSRLAQTSMPGWAIAAQAFKRRKQSPPVEVKQAMSLNAIIEPSDDETRQTRMAIPGRLAALRPRKIASSDSSQMEKPAQRPTVIPAPPRGHTWSPDISRHSPVNPLQNMGANTTLQVHPAIRQYTQRRGQEAPTSTNASQEAKRTSWSDLDPQQLQQRHTRDLDVVPSPTTTDNRSENN